MIEKIAIVLAIIIVGVLTMTPVHRQVVDLRYQWIMQPAGAAVMQSTEYMQVGLNRLPPAATPQQQQPIVIAKAGIDW